MKFWDLLIKIIEIITPTYMRKKLSERHERLKKFFEEKERINSFNWSERVKEIQLNSAVEALTGTRMTNNLEFDYFVESFDPSRFENDYWAFARFRTAFDVIKNENDQIVSIKINSLETYKMIGLNIFVFIMFLCVPATLYWKKGELYKAYHQGLGIPVEVLNTIYIFLCFLCFITIIKLFYDWSLWNSLKKQIKQKYSKEGKKSNKETEKRE